MGKVKDVRVAIRVDQSFIRLLNAQVQLSGGMSWTEYQTTPMAVLARVFLAEARGGLETEVDMLIPPDFRPNMSVEHDLRAVTEQETT